MAAPGARPQFARQHGWAMALCALVAAVSFATAGGVRPAAAQFTDTNPPWVGIPPVPKVPTASSRMDSGASDPNAQIQIWDWRYYGNQLKKEKYTVDSEQLRVYFPYEKVL